MLQSSNPQNLHQFLLEMRTRAFQSSSLCVLSSAKSVLCVILSSVVATGEFWRGGTTGNRGFGQRKKTRNSGLMVTKCANPSCSAVFRYLKGGRLFLFEAPPRLSASVPSTPETEFHRSQVRSGEYFWLCEECAKNMTITSDENGHAFVAAYEPRFLKGISE